MEICAFLFPRGSAGKESTCNAAMQETWVQSLGKEDLLEYEMATHSSILAWKIPWRENFWLARAHKVAKTEYTCTHTFFSVEIEGWSNMHSQHGNVIAG